MPTNSTNTGVLGGRLVVEMSEVLQAPLAAQMLGDLGADVVKVERAGGEILRRIDFAANEAGGMSSYFAAVNRNKRSIVLDLKSAEGKQDLKALLTRADVLVHNYRPGVLERLGFGYEDVKTFNPAIVYASASGFGATGPLAMRGGQDLILQSLSGMAMAAADVDGVPRFANVPAIDFASGTLLAQGVLAALLHRERTGEGQQVAVSLLDTAVAMQALEAASELMYGCETKWFARNLNFVMKTQDGWITVIGFFRSNPLALMCRAMGLPDASERPEFTGIEAQIAHRKEIGEMLAPLVARHTTEEAVRRFQDADVLCAPILNLAQAIRHPQVKHNGLLIRTPLPGRQDVELIGSALHLSETPPALRRGPPALDGDRDEIRDRWLSPIHARS
jgi:crotonobetainyl-CoA:carnitine CoA-transferase CaiB-like acyl-CoA transferase